MLRVTEQADHLLLTVNISLGNANRPTSKSAAQSSMCIPLSFCHLNSCTEVWGRKEIPLASILICSPPPDFQVTLLEKWNH